MRRGIVLLRLPGAGSGVLIPQGPGKVVAPGVAHDVWLILRYTAQERLARVVVRQT